MKILLDFGKGNDNTSFGLQVIRLICLLCFCTCSSFAQKVDYSVVSVNEESGLNFMRITSDNDYVCMPVVKRNSQGATWLVNTILDISKNGDRIAYLSARNNSTNIFIKELNKQGSSVQRTNRQAVLDFSYSPDGKYIVFTEMNGKTSQLFQTSSELGYVCRQITSGNQDYSPHYSKDMKQIFFARQEANGASIWSYNIANNFLSSFSVGYNPCPLSSESSVLCVRTNAQGLGEIWNLNYVTGTEECIVSDANRSFSSPVISPDGKWILFVGSNGLNTGNTMYYNTDIFVCSIDGSNLSQLTYHAADDLSPVWSSDGKYIYFISQRGSANGTANIWRMDFAF